MVTIEETEEAIIITINNSSTITKQNKLVINFCENSEIQQIQSDHQEDEVNLNNSEDCKSKKPQRNMEKYREYQKKYREAHKDYYNNSAKQYYVEHKEKRKEYDANYIQDPIQKRIRNNRARIYYHEKKEQTLNENTTADAG